ncbi:dihydroxyacetone kinase phosphoryl donor subunit DhaM [Pseudogracilibacillus auburnensis]|uniref:phosphoenolpyruvate--glycerone phosphotransferase n=1 Tax=Pseudogracilibacillus auburnensis TaxID=1494959 RepID=A0A2V3W042_9BACI|nr:dihydroxyacetone kinase phosphoryl donor subunit DhaM [Pseudogracilibacillus auburnensis]MBO1004085.1 PTS-dependent dihydroxyacetone kinase phosphotransferase subunit DhaM [Pseudogracilibacillus auburnensis]PXW85625.1 dihydroxyacetone kinase DhaM subunit [Pseudogracilibacillus auburnensis]
MGYVGIVLISHSEKVACGIKDIIRQVIQDVPVEVAGGTDDGKIGTSMDRISAAIECADQNKGILLFYDLGSAKMNAELAIEMSEKENIKLAEAPLLEGSYVGAVESSMGKSIAEIIDTLNKNF